MNNWHEMNERRACTTKRPTVVLADDHPGNLERISRTLGDEFNILAKVRDGLAAFQSVLELQPDILILDFSMPRMNGIQAASELRKRGFRSAILFVTIQADDDYMEVLSEIRAGFVSKLKIQTELVPAVRAELQKTQ
jgi:DNA-binding NarL/FixJ family response regulator